jgi:hypothetical protein
MAWKRANIQLSTFQDVNRVRGVDFSDLPG